MREPPPDSLAGMLPIASRLEGFGAAPDDTDDERLAKATLATASLLIVPSAAVWGTVFLLADRPLAAAMPYAYVVIATWALWLLRRSRSIDLPRRVVLVTMSVLPFTLQWVLGGYSHSGAVSMWALMVPALAFMFGAPPGRWVVAFVGLSVISGVLDPTLAERFGPLPPTMVRVLFVINAVAVGATYFTALMLFTMERSRTRAIIEAERERADALLLNVLPPPIAERLKAGEHVIADAHPAVSILFADIVGFTTQTAGLAPETVVAQLDDIFSAIDGLVARYGLEKIKTIGDAYEVVGGAPAARDDHAEAVAELALDLLDQVAGMPLGDSPVTLRIGIDTGGAVGAVIGSHKFTYDLWGDAVNTASRMESHGVAGRIHVTDRYRRLLGDRYEFEPRGEVDVRGKGPMTTWFLTGRAAPVSAEPDR